VRTSDFPQIIEPAGAATHVVTRATLLGAPSIIALAGTGPTGVIWVDGELWHGTWQEETSDVRRIDTQTGEALERLDMSTGTGVSDLESDGSDRFFCGGGSSGKGRAIRHRGRRRDDLGSRFA